ncbi:hypothetical protein HGRIS_001346 [Hohenbuehelia grisea]|uniref:Uncharacterized protein n=1 Tax=Hohenbuehelia grisea TaxID=104357 RepID=A0ABR3JP21_9AGAR
MDIDWPGMSSEVVADIATEEIDETVTFHMPIKNSTTDVPLLEPNFDCDLVIPRHVQKFSMYGSTFSWKGTFLFPSS